MLVTKSRKEDLDLIFDLFNEAIRYQQSRGFNLWPVFKREMIEKEIEEERHWKIVEGDAVLCVFSVQYTDPFIWGPQKDEEPAIYLHRIAVNPGHKGKNCMVIIKNWAIEHATQHGKKFIRMDTWGSNENLRNYYIHCGFPYIGQQYLEKTDGLPEHYGGSILSLFELKV